MPGASRWLEAKLAEAVTKSETLSAQLSETKGKAGKSDRAMQTSRRKVEILEKACESLRQILVEHGIAVPIELSAASLTAAFELFDKDGRGTIKGATLRAVLKGWAYALSNAEVDELMQEAGFTDSSQVDYAKFAERMLA